MLKMSVVYLCKYESLVGGCRGSLIPQLGFLVGGSLASSHPCSARALLLHQKSSPEVGEQSENTVDITLSVCYDGSDASRKEILSTIDAIVQFQKPTNQKEFLRVQFENLSFNPCSSYQIAKNEKEKKATVNICEERFGSPIEIVRAYLDSMNKKATPVDGLQGKICHEHKAPFESKLANDAIASKSALCFPIISKDIRNNYMTRKSRGNSRRCELSRYPCWRSSILANPKALKRSSSDRYIRCFGDARRVRHKPVLWDINLVTHADIL